jgi:hypothetical protein
MLYARSFYVPHIVNEVDMDSLRNCLELLGTIFRIDAVKRRDSLNNVLYWSAYVYFDTWNPYQINALIDNEIQYNSYNVVCFIHTGFSYSIPSIADSVVNMYLKELPGQKYLLLCRNYNPMRCYAGFEPEHYSLYMEIPVYEEGSRHLIEQAVEYLGLGDILLFESHYDFGDAEGNPWEMEMTPVKQIMTVHFRYWNNTKDVFDFQGFMANYGFVNLLFNKEMFDEKSGVTEDQIWTVVRAEPRLSQALPNPATWMRPDRHIRF